MNLFLNLYLVSLFVALTPGVLFRLPKGGSKLTVAVVHAAVFALIYHLTYKMVWRATVTMSGFQSGPPNNAAAANAAAGNAAAANAAAANALMLNKMKAETQAKIAANAAANAAMKATGSRK